ncbi:MAG: hypothetical protein KDK41_18230 [Leptospiraceae bacterium]|nr:hypothetical protein [Leptospiraceae bacterium]
MKPVIFEVYIDKCLAQRVKFSGNTSAEEIDHADFLKNRAREMFPAANHILVGKPHKTGISVFCEWQAAWEESEGVA